MANLSKKNWIETLNEEVLGNKIPFLGICLGMQLLADSGEEGKSVTKGLGFIKGKVIKFAPKEKEKVPHVGWNEVGQKVNHRIFDSVENHKDFYFVHSYHFAAESADNVIASTPYCGEFASAIARDNIVGVQFHPEKSQVAGMQVLRNFIAQC